MASLEFVYGLLLGNCGYQTDRKIYDQSEIAVVLRSSHDPRAARDKIINSLRQKNELSSRWVTMRTNETWKNQRDSFKRSQKEGFH